MAGARVVENIWHGTGEVYRTRGARVWRIVGQGWFAALSGGDSRRVRGPLSNALSAMEAADRMLAAAAGERADAAA
jgi:hypothetical protein